MNRYRPTKYGGAMWAVLKDNDTVAAMFDGTHAQSDAFKHAALCNERNASRFSVEKRHDIRDKKTGQNVATVYPEDMAYRVCVWLNSQEAACTSSL